MLNVRSSHRGYTRQQKRINKRPLRRLIVSALLLNSSVAMLFGQPAQAKEPDWSSPAATLSTTAPGSQPKVAVDSGGGTTAVWTEKIDNGNRVVKTAFKAPGGSGFGPAETLSNPDNDAVVPDLAADSTGNVTVIWFAKSGNLNYLYERHRSVGGSFSQEQTISGADYGDLETVASRRKPEIAVDGGGNFTAIWVRDYSNKITGGSLSSVEIAQRQPGSNFGSPDQLLQTTQVVAPAIAVNTSGDTVLGWLKLSSDDQKVTVQTAFRASGGNGWQYENVASYWWSGWGTLQPTPAPELALNSSGQAAITWNGAPSFGTFQNWVALRPIGLNSSFGSPKLLAADVDSSDSPNVGVESNGSATVLWKGKDHLTTAYVPSDGSPVSFEEFGDKNAGSSDLAVDSKGNAVAVWATDGDYNPNVYFESIKTAYRPAGGKFGDPVSLSNLSVLGATAPDLAISSDGSYFASAWRRSGTRVEASWSLGSKVRLPDKPLNEPEQEWPPNPIPGVDPGPVGGTIIKDQAGWLARRPSGKASGPRASSLSGT